MSKPRAIQEIEKHYGLQLKASTAANLADFMRYGRREEDKNQYLLEGDRLIGLNVRTNDLADFPFLTHPDLQGLQALKLCENKWTALHFPAEMDQLQLLDLSDNTELRQLTFGGELAQLQVLDLSDSGLESLKIPSCPALETLDVSRNKLKTLVFTSACPLLRSLDASGNKELKKLRLPAGFQALRLLHLSGGGLEHLSIEGALPSLRMLDLKNNQLEKLPSEIILNSPLYNLYAEGNSPRNIPKIFLEGDSLAEARAWFQELRDHPHEANKAVKLMIIGNGNVGKTTLMCALESGEERCGCKTDHVSTHGIQIGTWEQPTIQYNYWDFGGQEVYHGTHQLFLSSEALQLIVFDPRTEESAVKNKRVRDRVREDQIVFNHPIEYWYETAREISPDSQFLIVQNKKGGIPEEDKRTSAYAREHKIQFIHLDAKNGENVDDLIYFLQKKARLLPDYQMLMPASWLKVRQFFIDNLEKEEPQRLISKKWFEETLCKDVVPKNRSLLFRYLHHSGFLYYHPNLGDQVIADQRWALEAIYKPLERSEKHYEEFREDLKGKIRVRRLFQEFGSEYKEEEKWLFLSFMESCKLCFKLNRGQNEGGRSLSDIYVFPEFLPGEKPNEVDFYWKSRAKEVRLLRYQMPWVHYYRVQSFIAGLGRKAALEKIWRYGIEVQTDQGRFMVELDYDQKALLVAIEASAAPHWLGAILEEFQSKREEGIKWEISADGGQSFEAFDGEQWKQRLHVGGRAPEGGEEAAAAGKLTDLKDVDQELDREVVLFMAAAPPSQKQISYESEYARISKAMQRKEVRGQVEMLLYSNVSPADMIHSVDGEKPHILHFVGHGVDPEGQRWGGGLIFFSDNRREDEKLNAREAGSVFKKLCYHHPQLQLVFLNACFSEPQAIAISTAGLYALGTSDRIGSQLAELFAEGFYHKYAQTKNIKRAAEHGLTLACAKNHEAEEFIHLFHQGKRVPLFNQTI